MTTRRAERRTRRATTLTTDLHLDRYHTDGDTLHYYPPTDDPSTPVAELPPCWVVADVIAAIVDHANTGRRFPRPCDHCGDTYPASTPNARFCSRRCQLDARRERGTL